MASLKNELVSLEVEAGWREGLWDLSQGVFRLQGWWSLTRGAEDTAGTPGWVYPGAAEDGLARRIRRSGGEVGEMGAWGMPLTTVLCPRPPPPPPQMAERQCQGWCRWTRSWTRFWTP